MSKVRSARGEYVDFDLLKVKQSIAASAAPMNVSSREDFMENRTRRRTARRNPIVKSEEIVGQELGPAINSKTLEEPVVKEEAVEETDEVTEVVEVAEDKSTRKIKK